MPPAALHADMIAGTDTHPLVTPTSPPAPVPFPFARSTWTGGLSGDVLIEDTPPVVSARIATGSATELIG